MRTFLIVVAVWSVCSVPLGVLIARFIAAGRGEE